jgi:hypothetical protein
LIVMSLVPASAHAAWPPGGRALCTQTGQQTGPTAVSDGAGGAIVLWSGGVYGALNCQHVLASGELDPAWPVDGVAVCTTRQVPSFPVIMADGAGGAYIAWTEAAFGSRDIYGQRVLASGTRAWDSTGVIIAGAANVQAHPGLVPDGSGGAIVSWQDARLGGSGTTVDIYATRLRSNGTVDPTWPVNGLPICIAPQYQLYPKIVSDGVGGAIIVWQDRRVATDYDIYAQRLLWNASGGHVDPTWPANGAAVCDAIGNQTEPRIVPDGAGGAVVAWLDDASGNLDIYAQRIRNSGVIDPAWPPQGHEIAWESGTQSAQAMVADNAGGAYIVWRDERSDAGDIYEQHMLGSGTLDPAWPLTGLPIGLAAGQQSSPAIVETGPTDLIVAWADYSSGTGNILAAKVRKTGSLASDWPVGGVAVCGESGNQDLPCLVRDGSTGAVCGWQDDRNGTWDIFAQHVGADGLVGSIAPDVSLSRYGSDAPGGPAMDVLGVSPANECVPDSAQYFYRVQLNDALGRPIANYPASGIWFDLSSCPEAYGRPADGIVHPDGNADAQGVVEWRRALAFGGAAPCAVSVVVSDGVTPGARVLHTLTGGVRSPDQDGDGFIAPADLDAWRAAYEAGGPAWRGDLGPSMAFDDAVTVADSATLALHEGCTVYYEYVLDQGVAHRVVIMGVVDHLARKIRGLIDSDGDRVVGETTLAPAGGDLLAGTLSLALPIEPDREVRYDSRFWTRTQPESLATDHDDSIYVCVPGSPPGAAGALLDGDSSKVCLGSSANFRDAGVRITGSIDTFVPVPYSEVKLSMSIKDTYYYGLPSQYNKFNTKLEATGTNWNGYFTKEQKTLGDTRTFSYTAGFGARFDSIKVWLSAERARQDGMRLVDHGWVRVEVPVSKDVHIVASGGGDTQGRGFDQWNLGLKTLLLGSSATLEYGSAGPDFHWKRKDGFRTFLGFLIPFATGLESTAAANGRMVVEQRTHWCCDDVCEDLPAIRDTIALVDECAMADIRAVFATDACAVADSGSVSPLSCGPLSAPITLHEPPASLSLAPSRPNPAAQEVSWAIEIPRAGRVRLLIYDLQGRRVATAFDQDRPPGRTWIVWRARGGDGAPMPAGVYFARLALGVETRTRKFVLAR